MNKLSFLSCVLLLILIKSEGQQRTTKAPEPPRKSSKIIVMVRDSSNMLLDRIAGALYDKGFTIENKDDKVKFISTKDLPSKKWATIYKIKARINDTAIVFTGQIAFNKDTDILGMKESVKTYWDIEAGKGGSMKEAWNELDTIARMFGDKVVYSK